ncbi:MAG: T9SS type A sorting domain-containing protein, partial [Bacteroidota bacterium]
DPTCWHYWSIVLEEGSDRIYIVDQRNTVTAGCVPSLTLGVQIDNASATEVVGSPNIAGSAGTNSTDADNIYYEFINGTRPDYDFDVKSTDLPTAVQGANAPFTFGVRLHNLGAQTINTFDLSYSVDGGAPVVSNISGANLSTITGGDYNVQIPWNPATNGIYDIKIWTSNLNGNPDANPLNDTLSQSVVVTGASPYYYNPSQVEATDEPAGNPGGLNTIDEFPLGGGLDASWTSIQGPSATPVWSPDQTIPFGFNFNGNPVTQYKVSTTGVLTFDMAATTVPGVSNSAIPSTQIPDQSVVVWGLNGTGGNDNIVTQTFGTAPNRQHWVFFSSYSYDGGGTCWHYWSIVLEEGSDKIYIVDQRLAGGCTPGLTLGIQVDDLTATQVVGSPNINGSATADATDADNIYYEFIFGTRPDYDVVGISTDLQDFLTFNNAPYTIDGYMHNLGAEDLNALDLNYSVDGGPVVSAALTGLSFPSISGRTFSSTVPWAPSGPGVYTIDIWADNLNGNPDAIPDNDTITKTVTVVGDFVPRRLLHEDFTSSSCPPCLPGGIQLRSVLASRPDSTHTLISYPLDFPSTGDPYHTEEAEDRRIYYGVTGIPNLYLDGGWDGNPNSYTSAIFDNFQSIPSFMAINATYNIDSIAPVAKRVTVEVTIDPLANFPSNNLRIFAAVFETLTFNNVSNDNPNGETEWHYYLKKMLPNSSGFPIAPLTANTPVTHSFDYIFPGNYRLPSDGQLNNIIDLNIEHSVEEFTDLGVVVFVQDSVTGEIFQSDYAEVSCNTLMLATETGPDNGSSNGFIKVLSTSGGIDYSYSLNGNAVMNPDSIGGLTDGIYQLTVTDGYGCSATESPTVGSNVSIDDPLSAGFASISTFPNPNNGNFTLALELVQADDLQLELFDAKGQIVFQEAQSRVQNYQKEMSLTHLPAGVYVLVARTSKGSTTERIVIK